MSPWDILPDIQQQLRSPPWVPRSLGFSLALIALLIHLFRQWALPKPIPGIPCRVGAVNSILGDFMAIGKYLASDHVIFFDWLAKQSKDLNSPIIQVFPLPFSRPVVVLNDFRETEDIHLRRGKELDRSSLLAEIFLGIVPNFHIVHKTNTTWKSHRRLLQDLMSPGFLNGVAAPAIYQHVSNLVRLWGIKAQLAQGRPFTVKDDIYDTALDAVHGFSFGQGFEHRALQTTLEYYEHRAPDLTGRLSHNGGGNVAIEFPTQEKDAVVNSVLTLTSTFAEVMGTFTAKIKWPILKRMPKVVKAKQINHESIRKEIQAAVERTQTQLDPSTVRSAVDHMVRREIALADRESRAPDFFSETMFDEIFGFVIAGHDTTSTTFSWGVKFLADNPQAQWHLRSALQESFSAARAEKRAPTVQEITSTCIPYLDATLEEILRCAGTIPAVPREAVEDTVVFGHRIPKGTTVFTLTADAGIRSRGFDIDESRRHVSSQEAKKLGKTRREWDPKGISAFKPERWLANDGEFDAASGPQLAFALGKRGCFGRKLAYVQLRILVTLVVWDFELMKCPDELSSYGHEPGLTCEPTHCFVRLGKVRL